MKFIVVLLVVSASWFLGKSAFCNARWNGTGYSTKYSLTAGCLVRQSNNKYLPENKVRSE